MFFGIHVHLPAATACSMTVLIVACLLRPLFPRLPCSFVFVSSSMGLRGGGGGGLSLSPSMNNSSMRGGSMTSGSVHGGESSAGRANSGRPAGQSDSLKDPILSRGQV